MRNEQPEVDSLRLEDVLVLQRPLQRGLHLHLAELVDGEVQVLQRNGAFPGVVLQKELGKMEASERDLRAEADLGGGLLGLNVEGTRLVRLTEEGSGSATTWPVLGGVVLVVGVFLIVGKAIHF